MVFIRNNATGIESSVTNEQWLMISANGGGADYTILSGLTPAKPDLVPTIITGTWQVGIYPKATLATLSGPITLNVVSASSNEGSLLVTGNGHSITFTEGDFTETLQTKAEGDTLICYANYAGNREVWVDNADGSAVSDNTPTGIYYVGKRFDGCAAATVSTLLPSGISSTNADYTKQLSSAQRGSEHLPFPCPFSARNAALKDLADNVVKNAIIIVEAGTVYTVGFEVNSKNGQQDGTNEATVADIGFPDAATGDLTSLAKHNVHTVFGQQAGLDYINATAAIPMVYSNIIEDFDSSITGEGVFRLLFGSGNGFNATTATLNNTKARFELKANKLVLQQALSFNILAANVFSVVVDTLISDMTVAFEFSAGAAQFGNVPSYSVQVKNLFFGYQKSGLIVSDSYWSFVKLRDITAGANINVSLENADMATFGTATLLSIAPKSSMKLLNTNLNLSVKNLVQKQVLYDATHIEGNLIEAFMRPGSKNNNININIENGSIESLLYSGGTPPQLNNTTTFAGENNVIAIHCDEMICNPHATLTTIPDTSYFNYEMAVVFTSGHSFGPNCITKISGRYVMEGRRTFAFERESTQSGHGFVFENLTVIADSDRSIFMAAGTQNFKYILDNVNFIQRNDSTPEINVNGSVQVYSKNFTLCKPPNGDFTSITGTEESLFVDPMLKQFNF